jgi:beta-glucosidase
MTAATAPVSVKVKNTGAMDGEEVVQLYIRDRFAYGVARPVKELKGFRKIALKKG